MTSKLRFRRFWLLSTFILLTHVGISQLTQQWVARRIGPAGNNTDGARSLALDREGNVYITGSGAGTGTGLDYITIKYNSAGVLQWESRYNGTGNADDDAFSIAVDRKGNVYVTGRSMGDGTGNDIATIKYNSAGVAQWVSRYNGPGNAGDAARSIAVDGDGNVYVTGESVGDGTGSDYATIKYNAIGAITWVTRYDGPGNDDAANALALDEAGNVYVTGRSPIGEDLDEEDADYTTIKHNANGAILWISRYDGPVAGNLFDNAHAITVDRSGNVYVTGTSAGEGGEDALDYATVKYNATTGAELWSARYNGPGNSTDQALSIAVDALQNVYVTGFSAAAPDETNYDYATIKYNVNGGVTWISRYNGPANDDDQASALALDGAGNVYVTGRSTGVGTNYDFTTIKYVSTSGFEQAVARYNGPGNDRDGTALFIGFFTSHPIAVDETGNVYVTGLSTGTTSGFDITTIKYAQPSLICGDKGEKVLLCHKGAETICVKRSAVSEHLGHGDQYGACAAPVATNARQDQPGFNNNALPSGFGISVVPNPVAATTKIFYDLPLEGRVSIQVFDMLGRQVTTLVDATKQAGFHNAEFNVATVQNGIYYYRIQVKTAKTSWSQTGKINVVK